MTAVAAGAGRPAADTARAWSGRPRPPMRQHDRAIDWQRDPAAAVIRRIRAAEGHPGVPDTVAGTEFHLFGAHREEALRGVPGEIVAQRHGAVCRATVDGAVWITHLKRPGHFKLPAARALALAGHELAVPEVPAPMHAPALAGRTFREIAYTERRGVGYLHFDFYNGAMSTRPVPAAARRVSLRARRADARDRADGRRRLLLQRDPPERDRGGRRSGRGVVVEPARDR